MCHVFWAFNWIMPDTIEVSKRKHCKKCTFWLTATYFARTPFKDLYQWRTCPFWNKDRLSNVSIASELYVYSTHFIWAIHFFHSLLMDLVSADRCILGCSVSTKSPCCIPSPWNLNPTSHTFYIGTLVLINGFQSLVNINMFNIGDVKKEQLVKDLEREKTSNCDASTLTVNTHD